MLKKLILEELRFLVEYVDSDSAESEYFDNIGMMTEDVFDLIEYQDSYHDLYPGYDPDIEFDEDEEYYYNSKEDAYRAANGLLEIHNSLENPIPIYRTIRVNSLEDIDYEYLGESWSLNRNSAIVFGGRADANVLLSAKTPYDNVDWKSTIKLWFIFSGDYTDDNEDELVIIDSDRLIDVKAEKIKYKR